MIELAKQHNLLLHAHSDSNAIDRIFQLSPEARVLWAHAGFDDPEDVGPMLEKHRNLWTDLAFRSEHAVGGSVEDSWRKLFIAFPDRIMVGTDTFRAGTLALRRRARQLDPGMAARPAAGPRRADRLAQRRRDDPAPRGAAAITGDGPAALSRHSIRGGVRRRRGDRSGGSLRPALRLDRRRESRRQ